MKFVCFQERFIEDTLYCSTGTVSLIQYNKIKGPIEPWWLWILIHSIRTSCSSRVESLSCPNKAKRLTHLITNILRGGRYISNILITLKIRWTTGSNHSDTMFDGFVYNNNNNNNDKKAMSSTKFVKERNKRSCHLTFCNSNKINLYWY